MKFHMRWGMAAGLLVCALGGGMASAQETRSAQFELNKTAYTGITLNDLFSERCMTVGAFIDALDANVPASPANQNVKDKLKAVKDHLNANPSLKDWYVISLFTMDGKGEAALKDLAGKLDEVEKAGLTIPCTHLWTKKTWRDFQALLGHTAFVQRLGRLGFADFFEIPITHPLLDDELIGVAQEAIRAGFLGAFGFYASKEKSSDSIDTYDSVAALDAAIRANGLCCIRTTKQCKTGSPTNNCTMCGSVCCFGSTWCP